MRANQVCGTERNDFKDINISDIYKVHKNFYIVKDKYSLLFSIQKRCFDARWNEKITFHSKQIAFPCDIRYCLRQRLVIDIKQEDFYLGKTGWSREFRT